MGHEVECCYPQGVRGGVCPCHQQVKQDGHQLTVCKRGTCLMPLHTRQPHTLTHHTPHTTTHTRTHSGRGEGCAPAASGTSRSDNSRGARAWLHWTTSRCQFSAPLRTPGGTASVAAFPSAH